MRWGGIDARAVPRFQFSQCTFVLQVRFGTCRVGGRAEGLLECESEAVGGVDGGGYVRWWFSMA